MVRAHGNWCGPGWTAGQYKDAKDITPEDYDVPAVDALDQACKDHDIGLYEGDPEANDEFYQKAYESGWTGTLFMLAVAGIGPPSHSYLREEYGDDMAEDIHNRIFNPPEHTGQGMARLRSAKKKPEREFTAEEKQVLAESDALVNPDEESKEEIISRGDIMAHDPNWDPDVVMTPAASKRTQSDLTRSQRSKFPRLREARQNRAARALNMEGDNGDVPMAAVRAEGVPASRGTAKMVTMPMYREPEYNPLTETRTCKLPLTIYLSLNRLNHMRPNGNAAPLRLRLNSPYDILKGVTLQTQVVSTARAEGISNDYAVSMKGTDVYENGAYLVPFPTTVVGPNAATNDQSSYGSLTLQDTVQPANRAYYFRNWTAWAPLKTDYKITILNAANQESDLSQVKFFTTKEQYTSVQGDAGSLVPMGPLEAALRFPNLTEHNVHPRNMNTNSSDYVVMSGSWTPNSVRTLNVFNEEDVRVWNKTGLGAGIAEMDPMNYECLTIMAYKHDMFPVAPRKDTEFEVSTTTTDVLGPVSVTGSPWTPQPATFVSKTGIQRAYLQENRPNLNLKIEMDFTVQVRDLGRNRRYLLNSDTLDTPLLVLGDMLQIPNTRELVPSTGHNDY